MPGDYETAQSKLEALSDWDQRNVCDGSRNEAATRLQLIDRLLFECLGWDPGDCFPEEQYEGTYADYSLGRPFRKLVVEAKKEGIYFELPTGFEKRVCNLKTLLEESAEIDSAIQQALQYCQTRGIPIGAVCNGHQLIAFIASRQDGVPPLEGRALVFSSLKDMLASFRVLWQNLSKPGVAACNIWAELRSELAQPPPEKLSRRLADYPGFKNRNALQTELKILGELFIEDIAKAPEIEEEFLRECYCQSGALPQYALISRQILQARYSILFQREIEAVALQPVQTKSGLASEFSSDILAASLSRRPIILLGDVGVGKTIFVRHFIRVDAKDVLERAIVLYVDFGKEPALAEDLPSFVLSACAKQLRVNYGIDAEERNFVRGVYHFELQRFANGLYSDLRKIDERAYLQKEIEFLEKKLVDTSSHLKSCLEHISKGQKRQIVIFLDNVDQRPLEFQERVFLIGHGLAETWPGTVFISLRPDSFFQSRARGSLTGYQPRVFTVPPPRVDLVISKRLSFALTQLTHTGRLASFPAGLSLNSRTLSRYIRVLLYSFENNRHLMEFVDNLSGGNIRRALEFLTAFVGSGHVHTQEILDAVEQTGGYLIPLHQFMRAVIFVDHEHYDPTASPIVNLFEISSPDGREHFLLPLILAYVERLGAIGPAEGFLEVEKIHDFCQGLGFQAPQIQFALDRARTKKLLEPSPRFSDLSGVASYRITTAGAYSVKKLISYFAYVDAVIVDTPIVDDSARTRIHDAKGLPERLRRAESFCQYLDEQWRLLANLSPAFDWSSAGESVRSEIRKIRSVALP